MAEIQTLALDRFEADGFDAVTVEDLAAASGVSASTIYRYFGTKEAIVTWDEGDQELTAELIAHLRSSPPLEAFRDTLVSFYSDETANRPLLRRVRFIYNNPQVHAAAIEQGLRDQRELAVGFAQFSGRSEPSLDDKTRAGVCMAALDAAIEEWQTEGNKTALAQLIKKAFAAI